MRSFRVRNNRTVNSFRTKQKGTKSEDIHEETAILWPEKQQTHDDKLNRPWILVPLRLSR
jgi:hypothetical protein